MMKKFNYLGLIAAVAFFSGCSGDANEKELKSAPVPVTIEMAGLNDGNRYFSASGKIESVESANLSTRTMGYVTGLRVKVGDHVRTGQLLLTLNNTDLMARKAQADAAVMQATAVYNNAKKDFERFSALFEKQSASQKEVDNITTQYEMAKSSLESARQGSREINAQLAYTNITAPFDGVIINTFLKEGDLASPGLPLLGLEGKNGLQVSAMIPESNISSVYEGMPVQVLVKSPGKEMRGRVTEKSLSSKNTGGQYLVKISLDSVSKDVLSGMYVNVKFPVAESKTVSTQGVFVDENALVRNGQLTGVYTVGEGDVAILRWLRLGNKSGDKYEVLSGLSENEKYIRTSDGRLYNGAKVSYTNTNKLGE
jgi:RND family efflux transporter MFP subunit